MTSVAICSLAEAEVQTPFQESFSLFSEREGLVFEGKALLEGKALNLALCAPKLVVKQGVGLENKPVKKPESKLGSKQDHLASAKRLSRAMRRIPINSKQHIQAGRLVCRHLVAMLHDSPAHNTGAIN